MSEVLKEGTIKDSGDRTEFSTGAVRDLQGEDKGACHLLPLDVIADMFLDSDTAKILKNIQLFIDTGRTFYLQKAIINFEHHEKTSLPKLILEVSIHYRDGAKKYKPNNWKKGIPVSSYISSGVRHFLKYIDGQDDEAHHRGFIWNMLGAIWTMENKPEMDDLKELREGFVDVNNMMQEEGGKNEV